MLAQHRFNAPLFPLKLFFRRIIHVHTKRALTECYACSVCLQLSLFFHMIQCPVRSGLRSVRMSAFGVQCRIFIAFDETSLAAAHSSLDSLLSSVTIPFCHPLARCSLSLSRNRSPSLSIGPICLCAYSCRLSFIQDIRIHLTYTYDKHSLGFGCSQRCVAILFFLLAQPR